jgi:hypothetical protein
VDVYHWMFVESIFIAAKKIDLMEKN